MDLIPYVRRPFSVMAVEITKDNIAEIAKQVGELRDDGNGGHYILVDSRLVPNVEKVYPGFYMTKMGNNVRCYAKRIFHEQFVEMDERIRELVGAIEEDATV
jgi:hypothetical protein